MVLAADSAPAVVSAAVELSSWHHPEDSVPIPSTNALNGMRSQIHAVFAFQMRRTRIEIAPIRTKRIILQACAPRPSSEASW